MSDEIAVSVRALAARELAALERWLPKNAATAHAERLADQYAGHVLYLVAWLGTRPIGHVLIRWRGSTLPALRPVIARHGHHPYLEDLFVEARYRSQSVGSQLLAAAEERAAARGHTHVGLAVATDNVRARALYLRRGYRDCELGEFPSRWSYVDAGGQYRSGVEQCVYLLKETEVRSF